MTNAHTHRIKIGVMGSASGPQTQDSVAREKARELGREIGKRNFVFVNGACPGLPHDSMLGAKEEGALTIGISPAFSEHEHIKEYRSPHGHDVIIYTGMGFMERDIVNIRTSDGVVIVGGGIGTLNEFTIAYEEGRPIGILTNSGGISDSIPYIVEELCKRKIAPNMVFDDDPKTLLDKLEEAIRTYPLPIHEDGRVVDKPEGRRELEEKEEAERERAEGRLNEGDGADIAEAGSRG